ARAPTRDLHDDLKKALASRRERQVRLNADVVDAEKKVSNLEGQLRQASPHRAVESIQSELEEARAACHRQEVLQEARGLLKQRIEAKMTELAAHVPVALGNRVTEHLSRLTGGLFDRVNLGRGLSVTHISENGAMSELWEPHHLSYGERHQA